eukprot:2135627-Prymnesium_polylepis.1
MAAPFEPSPSAQHAMAAEGTAVSDGARKNGEGAGAGCRSGAQVGRAGRGAAGVHRRPGGTARRCSLCSPRGRAR